MVRHMELPKFDKRFLLSTGLVRALLASAGWKKSVMNTNGYSKLLGFSVAADLNLALTAPEDMRGLVLLGEIFVEYSRFSKEQVLQTTSALLGGTDTSDVHLTELNVTLAPMFRYDGWKVVRPFFIPVGLAFLVNSPPSNGAYAGVNF